SFLGNWIARHNQLLWSRSNGQRLERSQVPHVSRFSRRGTPASKVSYAAACCWYAGTNSSATKVSYVVGVLLREDLGSRARMCPVFRAPAISRISPTKFSDIPICTMAAFV